MSLSEPLNMPLNMPVCVCVPFPPAQLRAFVGVSGAFDLRALSDHLHRRGLYRGVFEVWLDKCLTLEAWGQPCGSWRVLLGFPSGYSVRAVTSPAR
jgi:hypothetical protein